MRYYIDTCVWIDFVEGEDYAENLFVRIITEETSVIISALFFHEFVRYKPYSGVTLLLSTLQSKGLLEHAKISNIQENAALRLSKQRNMPFGDALHAILARDNGSKVITRDKHFLALKDICIIELL